MDFSLSLTENKSYRIDNIAKGGLAIAAIGFLGLLLTIGGFRIGSATMTISLTLGSMAAGVGIFTWRKYALHEKGIKNDGVWHAELISRGAIAWALGIVLTGFYILLYWYPSTLGYAKEATNFGIVAIFDPLSQLLKGEPASQWFMYGTLYTFAILVMGIKFIYKYRHSKYHVVRTISVMFFQLGFAFLIPEILRGLNQPAMDLKNMWPLNYDLFYGWQLKNFLDGGTLGMIMLIWGVLMVVLISPILTYFYGKRWYCSWVCGCGGLAETAGDPFRHLSDNSMKAWKIERWMVHSVLVFVVIMTAMVLYTYFTGNSEVLGLSSYKVRAWYGFGIGAIFSGVVGVGFYPLLGNRVWCRFGCPMAAILGIQQRFFSRFRITSNGGQCISCGNCSTYCEMGIDVRAYAQKGQDIVRASCVGCGICAEVCPRGVLRLENGPDIENRATELRALKIDREGVELVD